MKKILTITFLIALGGITVSFMGCSDDKDTTGPETQVVTPETHPTEDAMTVTSSLRTYVFQHDYDEVATALVNRMKNRAATLDGTVKTVILHAENAKSLSEEQYELLLTVFAADGNLVVITPTVGQWNTFAASLVAAADRMIAANNLPASLSDESSMVLQAIRGGLTGDNKTLYIHDGGEEHADEHFCDMVALRGNDTYYLDDLNDADDTTQTTTIISKDEAGNVTSSSSEIIKWTPDYTAFDYGLHADMIVEWLNKQPDQRQKTAKMMAAGRELLANTRSGSSDLQELLSAQTETYQFSVHTAGLFKSVALATVTNDIWTLNDLDKHEDYYLIHQKIDAKNSGLNCGPSDKESWYERDGYGHTWMCYGGYMTQLKSNNRLSGTNADSKVLKSHTPLTTTGSSSYTTDLSFNLGGNVGIGTNGPSAGISGGVTFGKQWTTTIPDLSLVANTDGENPNWTYSGGSPAAHAKLHYQHDSAKTIQQNDCEVNHTWIWCVPQASGIYTLTSDVNVQTEILAFRTKGLWWSGSQYFPVDNWQQYSLQLTPPARALQRWQMSYSSSTSDNVDDYLRNTYPDYWKPSLAIYTSTDSDTSAADSFFAKFTSVIKNDVDTWKGNGHTGTFTFNLKREGTSVIHKSYKLEVK